MYTTLRSDCIQSFPSRERGLKLKLDAPFIADKLSFPSRERGLKQYFTGGLNNDNNVVPLAGTWIETSVKGQLLANGDCRSPRGNVD